MTPAERKQDTIRHRAMKKADRAQALDDFVEEQHWKEQAEQAELLNPVHEVRMRSDNAGSSLAIAKSIKELRAIEKVYILSYRDMCVDPNSEWFGWTLVNKQGAGGQAAVVSSDTLADDDVVPAVERLPGWPRALRALQVTPGLMFSLTPMTKTRAAPGCKTLAELMKQLGKHAKQIKISDNTYFFKKTMNKKTRECQGRDVNLFVNKVIKIMKEDFDQDSLFI